MSVRFARSRGAVLGAIGIAALSCCDGVLRGEPETPEGGATPPPPAAHMAGRNTDFAAMSPAEANQALLDTLKESFAAYEAASEREQKEATFHATRVFVWRLFAARQHQLSAVDGLVVENTVAEESKSIRLKLHVFQEGAAGFHLVLKNTVGIPQDSPLHAAAMRAARGACVRVAGTVDPEEKSLTQRGAMREPEYRITFTALAPCPADSPIARVEADAEDAWWNTTRANAETVTAAVRAARAKKGPADAAGRERAVADGRTVLAELTAAVETHPRLEAQITKVASRLKTEIGLAEKIRLAARKFVAVSPDRLAAQLAGPDAQENFETKFEGRYVRWKAKFLQKGVMSGFYANAGDSVEMDCELDPTVDQAKLDRLKRWQVITIEARFERPAMLGGALSADRLKLVFKECIVR